MDVNHSIGRPLVIGLCAYEVAACLTDGKYRRLPMLSSILKRHRGQGAVMAVALTLDLWLQYHLWIET